MAAPATQVTSVQRHPRQCRHGLRMYEFGICCGCEQRKRGVNVLWHAGEIGAPRRVRRAESQSARMDTFMSDDVLDLLRRRARSRPPYNDGASLALCIEGGAMRGVVSAGMVVGLEQLKMLNCFDAIYGSSAGAI